MSGVSLKNLVFLVSLCLFAIAPALSQTPLTERNASRLNIVVPSDRLDPDVRMFEGNVVLVPDGDAVSIAAKSGAIYSIRLYGIDAPERSQAYGQESAKQLAALIQGMDVVVVIQKSDENDNYIAIVYLDGEDVSLVQLKKGMAWYYPKYDFGPDSSQNVLEQAETTAREAKIGLWKDASPVSPWEFRGENYRSPSQTAKAALQTTEEEKTVGPAVRPSQNKTNSSAGKQYVLGPRGGCYYLRDGGVKVYVKDKTLCTKQQ